MQKPFRTLTAMLAHCNEYHQVEFGMKYSCNNACHIIVRNTAIQNHDFPSLHDCYNYDLEGAGRRHYTQILHSS